MRLFPHENAARSRRIIILFAAALILAVATGAWLIRRHHSAPTPELATPLLALETLKAGSLYYNAAARPWLLAHQPELLSPEDRDERSERVRDFVQAVQNPTLFRQLDRRLRFDALLLVGDPSQFRPLLDHLLETRDWTLTYLDHTSLVYRRGAERAWQPSDLAAVRQRFSSKREEATVLGQAAGKLVAVRQAEPARQLLDEAERLDSEVPDVWSSRAAYHLSRGEWSAALTSADRALAIEDNFLPAMAAKTQALYATKKLNEALALSTKLLAMRPDDPGLLFYHGKMAHDARSFREEIAALEKLVSLAEREARPTSGYRIYLAQAYAAEGDADRCIEQFTHALTDPGLSAEQRTFAQETLAQVRDRARR